MPRGAQAGLRATSLEKPLLTCEFKLVPGQGVSEPPVLFCRTRFLSLCLVRICPAQCEGPWEGVRAGKVPTVSLVPGLQEGRNRRELGE